MYDWISPGTARTLFYYQYLSVRPQPVGEHLEHLRGAAKEGVLLML